MRQRHYTRFELIDTAGRAVVHDGSAEAQEQDEGQTLKVFIDKPARAKDAELIQMLVDALEQLRKEAGGIAYHITMLRALDAATAAGFKPFATR